MVTHSKDGKHSKTKVDAAVEQLRQAILKGEIGPGEWLRQDEIAERFGISSTPVREGLRRLEAEGLVEHVPRRGVKVIAYTLNSVREYYDLRSLLEPYVVRLAASQMSAQDLADLDDLVAQAHALLASNAIIELTEANWKFHDKLMSLCGSRLVQDVLTHIRRSYPLDSLLMFPERATASVYEHQSLVEALKRGDVDQAAKEMETHIAHARDAMLARLPTLGTVR